MERAFPLMSTLRLRVFHRMSLHGFQQDWSYFPIFDWSRSVLLLLDIRWQQWQQDSILGKAVARQDILKEKVL